MSDVTSRLNTERLGRFIQRAIAEFDHAAAEELREQHATRVTAAAKLYADDGSFGSHIDRTTMKDTT